MTESRFIAQQVQTDLNKYPVKLREIQSTELLHHLGVGLCILQKDCRVFYHIGRTAHLVVVHHPVWQGFFLLATAIGGTAAGVCGRVVPSRPVHLCQTRGSTWVLNSHLWCLVSIALDISQSLLFVESMII